MEENMAQKQIPDICSKFIENDNVAILLRRFINMADKDLHQLIFRRDVLCRENEQKKMSVDITARVANGINRQFELSLKSKQLYEWIDNHNIFIENNKMFLRFFAYPNFPIWAKEFNLLIQKPESPLINEGLFCFEDICGYMQPQEFNYFKTVCNSLRLPIKLFEFDVEINSILKFTRINN